MGEAERVRLRRARIGFTFQSNNLIPYLTARENVEFMLRLNDRLDKVGRIRTEELLARLGLEGRLHSLPAQMSGGQQQRVAIARALINDPVLILADEPTGALDSRTSVEIMALFQDLNREGITVVVVTHEHDIARYAGRVLSFRDGRLTRDEAAGERLVARELLATLPSGDASDEEDVESEVPST